MKSFEREPDQMAEISKLLVANRGEIASRVFRTASRMGITTVAVFSEADALLPYVSEADEAIAMAGSAARDTYLSMERMIEAARLSGADAVHPGYGFLSENAEFARRCAQAGLVFVGPSPESMDAMGSKVRAKELMDGAGVPVLASVTLGAGTDTREAASRVGFPLLVKAAFGGGGRGMRVVRSHAELADSVATAEREAESAFGDGTVFVERYVESPRHIEVQIFGDHHGNVVHLFERECSIQRRYQKVVEESPSPVVDEGLRSLIGTAAITAGKALGYVGAGTVEFVLDKTGEFFFLEVNTRLQVEHPVTELVTGLDLVELQIRVARGEALPQEALRASTRGHAVEARLYAEDVDAGFAPASGIIDHFDVPASEGIRVDSGYSGGSSVSTYYDAMLAKVIAWGESREEATRRLEQALARTRVHGVPTNLELLVAVLRHPEFVAGRTDTDFLDKHVLPFLGAQSAADREVLGVAAALADQARRRATALVQTSFPSGWRNVASGLQTARLADRRGTIEIGYRFERGRLSLVEVDGTVLEDVELWRATPDAVDMTLGGIRRTLRVDIVGDHLYVDSGSDTASFVRLERFPLPEATSAEGSLLAPMPGTVARVLVGPEDKVSEGQVLVVIEAMKMEHAVKAPYSGTVVSVDATPGSQVDAGTVLALVEPEGPASS